MNCLKNRHAGFVVCLATLTGVFPATASEVVLGKDPAKVAESIRAAVTAEPLALRIENGDIDATSTEGILHALDDRHRKRGLTVAIAVEGAAGATIIALACDALVTLPTAQLRGASKDWCGSESQVEDLVDELVTLGQLPQVLASRLVIVKGVLEWSSAGEFIATADGVHSVASVGAPVQLDAAFLLASGLSSREFATTDDAVKAIEGKEITPRTSKPDGVNTAAPEQPAIPQVPSPSIPAPRSPTIPAAPSVPAPPSAPTAPNPKFTKALEEHRSRSILLQRDLAEFDLYYRGTKGVWLEPRHDPIRDVEDAWRVKVKIPHKATRDICSHLQSDIREHITFLQRYAKAIIEYAPDPSNPERIRVESQTASLKELYRALDKDACLDYERLYPIVKTY